MGAEAARQVPGEVHHGNDGLVVLQLVVLVALHGQPVLLVGHGADVPGNVVAPALHTRVETTGRQVEHNYCRICYPLSLQTYQIQMLLSLSLSLSLCKHTHACMHTHAHACAHALQSQVYRLGYQGGKKDKRKQTNQNPSSRKHVYHKHDEKLN